MLTNSRDIIRRLEKEAWRLVRVTGSHRPSKSDKIRRDMIPCLIREKTCAYGTVLSTFTGKRGWPKN